MIKLISSRILCAGLLLLSLAINSALAIGTDQRELQGIAHWTKLTADSWLDQQKNIPLFNLATNNGSAATLIVVDLKEQNLIPFFNLKTTTTSNAARVHHALAAVNGGYFNLSNSESISYVVINGLKQCEPKTNKALVENAKLKPYLPAIFNRSELRILKNKKNSRQIQICKHNEPIPADWNLESSLQAGPQLLPELTDKQEAFVRTNPAGTIADSIGSRRTAARTACGITPDGHVLLICVGGKGHDEFSSGVTLADLAQIMKELGCERALNFDGGTSSTMVIGNQSDFATTQVCGGHPEKLVKSGLLVIESK